MVMMMVGNAAVAATATAANTQNSGAHEYDRLQVTLLASLLLLLRYYRAAASKPLRYTLLHTEQRCS